MQRWQMEEARRHQGELLQEARQYRFYRESLSGRQRSPRLRPRALIWFGGRLIAWGNRLQGRYETLGTSGSGHLSGAIR